MKKSIKILSIVLALALLCAAAVIGVVASGDFGYDYAAGMAENVAGENFNFYLYDFNSATVSRAIAKSNTALKSDNNKNIVFQNGYPGKLSVEQSADGNKYLQIDYGNSETTGTATGGYLELPTGNSGSHATATTISGYKSLAELKYHVMDFDIFFPEEEIAGTPSIYLHFRAYTNEVSGDKQVLREIRKTTTYDLGYATSTYGVKFVTEGEKIYATPSAITNGERVAINNSSWAHITIITEGVIRDSGTADTTADDVMDIVCYTAVNGVIISSYTLAAPSYQKYGTTYYNNDMTKIYVPYARFAFGSATNDLQIDNIAIRSYSRDTYNDTLASVLAGGVDADLTQWDRNAYDANNMPLGNIAASLNGVGYDSVEKAVNAALAGDTIKLLKDVSDATVNKRVTIDTNGYTIGTINVGEGLRALRVGSLYRITDSGIVDSGYLDFENTIANVDSEGNYNSTSTVNLQSSPKAWKLDYKSGAEGTVYFPTKNDNRYLRYDYIDQITGTSAKNPYIYVNTDTLKHAEYTYHTVDFDMFLPTGKIADSTYVAIFNKRVADATTGSAGNAVAKMYYDENTGRNYWDGVNEDVYIENDRWTHFTIILQLVTTNSGYTMNMYVAADGGKAVLVTTQNGTTEDYVSACRMVFTHNTNSSIIQGAEVAYDNISLRSYPAAYSGKDVLASIAAGTANVSDWADNNYDPSVTPYGNDVASFGGVKYDRIQDAVDAAAKGNTVTVLKSTNQSVVLRDRIVIDTCGNSIGTVTSVAGLAVKQSGNIYTAVGSPVYQRKLDFEGEALDAKVSPDNATSANYNFKSNTKFYVALKNTVSSVLTPRPGTAAIVESNSNRYYRYDWEAEKNGAGDVYIFARPATDPVANSDCDQPLNTRPLYVLDLDYFSPTGKIASGTSGVAFIQFTMKYATTTTRKVYHSAANSIKAYHDEATGLNYVKNLDGDKFYLPSNAWTHFTATLESTPGGGSYETTIRLWMDGKYCGVFATASDTPADMYNSSMVNLAEIRLTFTAYAEENYTSNASAAYDNIEIRGFDNNYSSNLSEVIANGGNISDWDDSIFNDEYVMPYGNTVITTADGTSFDRVDEAIAYDKTQDVKTLTIEKSFPEELAPDYETTVRNTNAYEITITPAYRYFIKDLGGGVYEIRFAQIVWFEYTSGGENITVYENEMTLQEVVDAADEGSTITFRTSIELMSALDTTSSSKNDTLCISKAITLDLNGNTLTVLGTATAAQATVLIYSAGVVVKGGTLTAGYVDTTPDDGVNDLGWKKNNYAYPMFQFGKASCTLTLIDCSFYGHSLFFSHSAKGCTLTVSGGEYHCVSNANGGLGGIFTSLSNTTVNVENASFYLGGTTGNLVSVCARDGSYAVGARSTYTFTNCNIVSANDTNIVRYSNEVTDIFFEGCAIKGNLGLPDIYNTTYTFYVQGQGYITLGSGNVISSYDEDNTIIADDYMVYKEESTKDISFKLSSGNHTDGNFVISAEPTTETYTFPFKVVLISSVELHEVKWYNHLGELVKTEQIFNNYEATPPVEIKPVVKSANGWWRQLYDTWSTTADGKNPTDSFVITGDVSYYYVESDPTPYLTAAKFNLKLMGHTQMLFYLPETLPEGIEVVGVYNSAGNAINKNVLTFEGTRSYRYVAGYVGAISIANDTKISVKFNATIDGVVHEFTQYVTLSPLRYINAVLRDYAQGTKLYSSEAHSTVANMLRYTKAVMDYHGRSNDTINELLDTYEEKLCAPIDNTVDTDFPESNMKSLGDAANYIKSITYEISSYEPRFKVTLKPGSNVVGIKLTTIGYTSGSYVDEGKSNWSLKTYSYDKTRGIYYYDLDGQFIKPDGTVVNGSGTAVKDAVAGDWSAKHIGVIYTQNIEIYNIDRTMTIVLTLEDGTTVEGEYNMDTYYNDIKGNVDADKLAKARYFLKALRAYGKAVEDYRFPNGMYPNPNSVTTNEKGNPEISVASFGATGDGVTCDFESIKNAFDFANKMGYDVAFPDGTYYIGAATNGTSIVVKTNVNFGEADFIFDDSAYTSTADNSYSKAIFSVESDYSAVTYEADSEENPVPAALVTNGIHPGATNIGFAPGFPALIEIYNVGVKNYIRHGANYSTTDIPDQREIVVVAADGTIDIDTPILFDYETINKMVVYRADDTPITISGGTFTTKANNMPKQYTYVHRGVTIMRSNVTFTDFEHIITGEGETGAPYHGFVDLDNCCNVLIRNGKLQGHKYYTLEGTGGDTGVSANNMGSYDITANKVAKFKFYNVEQTNFWYGDPNDKIVNGTDNGGIWGICGTNDCKNMVYDSCTLARYDAHRGMTNGSVVNSTISGVSILGGGTFRFENNIVYSNDPYIISLREDYGGTWWGNIYFADITWNTGAGTTSETTSPKALNLALLQDYMTPNHNFGYACQAPDNIYVSGTITINTSGIATYKKYFFGSTTSTAPVEFGSIYVGNLTEKTSTTCGGCSSTTYSYDSTTEMNVKDGTEITVNGSNVSMTGGWGDW